MSARQSDLLIINREKRTCRILYFAVSADHKEKLNECEKRDKYIDLAKSWKSCDEFDDNINWDWCSSHSHQRISTRTGGHGYKRTIGDHPNYCIMNVGQNTEKSAGDLTRFVVTQTPVSNHYQTLVWKTLKREQIKQESETLRENWISLNRSTKQRHKD